MKGVHPKVNLSITVIDQSRQGDVYLERVDVGYSPNEDNTYDVKVTYNYTTDLSVQTLIVQCEVTGELGQHFCGVTTAEISFPPAYPVIDEGFDPKHIYLEKNRTGEIGCSIRTSDPETNFVWRVIDSFLEDKMIFYDCMLRALPVGDTFIVSLKCSYVVEDEDVDRLTVQCQVTDSIDEQYQKATKVELLFPKKAQSLPAPTSVIPVIDGCNGKHDICTLTVQSEGELTCRVENIYQSVELRWNIINGHQWQVLIHQMEVAGDFITRSLQYEVKTSPSILSAECVTVDGTDERIPEVSSKVVLVTEGVVDSSNKSLHGTVVTFSLLTMFLVIAFGLIVIILFCCKRKVYKQNCVMKDLNPECGVAMFGHSILEVRSFSSGIPM